MAPGNDFCDRMHGDPQFRSGERGKHSNGINRSLRNNSLLTLD